MYDIVLSIILDLIDCLPVFIGLKFLFDFIRTLLFKG